MLVYIDTGGWLKELRPLKEAGVITLLHFPYEQRLKRMNGVAEASDLRWNDSCATWADMVNQSWGSTRKSMLFDMIESIVGKQNRADVQHLDSAAKSNCKAFLTSDKGDIWRRRDQLEPLLDIRIFHSATELPKFLDYVKAVTGHATQ
jgi:hypothetical protein